MVYGGWVISRGLGFVTRLFNGLFPAIPVVLQGAIFGECCQMFFAGLFMVEGRFVNYRYFVSLQRDVLSIFVPFT